MKKKWALTRILVPSTGRAKAYDGVGISLALHQASDLDGAAGALVRKS